MILLETMWVVKQMDQNDRNAFLKLLQSHSPVEKKKPKKVKSSPTNPFIGNTVVFTGSLKSFTREQAENYIIQLGGQVKKTISKDTDYLIVAAPGDFSAKTDKAKQLGTPIMDEATFMDILEHHGFIKIAKGKSMEWEADVHDKR